jgi:AcrR family transcriptional regulator
MVAGRTYAGRTLDERRAERRQRLIAAGLQEFGTAGYRATSVKDLCARAGLTERYFYEQFADREAILIAVFDHVIEIVSSATFAAVTGAPANESARMRAGIHGFLEALSEDPRRARVQLVEVVGQSAELERRRFAAMHTFASFIESTASELDPARRYRPGSRSHAIVMALVGGTNHLAVEWTLGDLEMEMEDLVDSLVALFEAAAGVPDL